MLDKKGAALDAALEVCRTQFECAPVPMVLPVHSGSGFNSVIDLLEQTLIRSGSLSPRVERAAVPPEMEQAALRARKHMLEAVAESDEALLNCYLEQGDLQQEQLIRGLRNAVLTRQFLPVYAGSALHNVGTWSLLNAIVTLLPSPPERSATHPSSGRHPESGQLCERQGRTEEPFSGLVFKTIITRLRGGCPTAGSCRGRSRQIRPFSTGRNRSARSSAISTRSSVKNMSLSVRRRRERLWRSGS